jgi:hypothetical protein
LHFEAPEPAARVGTTRPPAPPRQDGLAAEDCVEERARDRAVRVSVAALADGIDQPRFEARREGAGRRHLERDQHPALVSRVALRSSLVAKRLHRIDAQGAAQRDESRKSGGGAEEESGGDERERIAGA